VIVVAAATSVLSTSAAGAAPVRTLSRVSLTSADGQATGGASTYPSISADGRLVAFASDATNLVPGDTNGATDVFVRDLSTGATERVSVRTNGTEATGTSTYPVISADGSAVVFTSTAPNLVTGDTNDQPDVFVRDLNSDTTTRVSVTSAGAEGSDVTGNAYGALSPSISADGHLVAFDTVYALVASDGNSAIDTYVHDRQTGTTTAASLDANDDIVDAFLAGSFSSAISGNGRFVAWYTGAAYVANDTNDSLDLYVRDRQAGTTERVSVQTGGGEADTILLNQTLPSPALSSDGRYVAFWLQASDLVPGDNSRDQFYVHDRTTGETERVSEPTGTDTPSNANSGPTAVAIAAAGRYVVFTSSASNLVTGDTNAASDVFVHDRTADETVRVNLTPSQAESTGGGSNHLGVTQSAAEVVFESPAADLVTSDTNAVSDVFVATANTAPTATAQSVTTAEDTARAITLTGTDPEGDPLTFTHGAAAHGAITGTGPDLLYTPASNYHGPDSFTFTVTDPGGLSDSALVSITVTSVNDAPVADDQQPSTPEDTALAITLTATDDGNVITFTHDSAAHGAITGTGANLLYTPASNYHGPDSFTFTVTDAGGLSDSALVSITVTSVNDAPVADDQQLSTVEDTALAITLTATDVDGDVLTFTHDSAAHGTITGSGASLTYTPAADYFGPDAFSFTVDDGHGGTDTGTIAITVTEAPMIATSLVADPAVVSLSGTPKLRLGTVGARLVRTDTGAGLAGRTIAFSVGAQPLCTATTDATGQAGCTLSHTATIQVLMAHGYDAAFAGDADFLPSSAHAGVVA
jgi:Tol biopolymer transport system component